MPGTNTGDVGALSGRPRPTCAQAGIFCARTAARRKELIRSDAAPITRERPCIAARSSGRRIGYEVCYGAGVRRYAA